MAAKIRPIPEGFSTVTPHLIIAGANEAIEFYKKAFDAVEQMRLPAPDGKRLMHAQIKIGNAIVMLCDEFPEMGGNCRSPKSLGGTGTVNHLYVQDVDAWFKRAVTAGATVIMPPYDMFWGDRYAQVTDPFGHNWSIATHTRDFSAEEMKRGCEEAMKHAQQQKKNQ